MTMILDTRHVNKFITCEFIGRQLDLGGIRELYVLVETYLVKENLCFSKNVLEFCELKVVSL